MIMPHLSYIEGNNVADATKIVGMSLTNFTWWYGAHINDEMSYQRNLAYAMKFRILNKFIATSAITSTSLLLSFFIY